MIKVPDNLDGFDAAFGNVEHLPAWGVIPDEFKRHGDNKYCDFVTQWFFRGRTEQDMKRLKEKPGVDRGKALTAIAAILCSFAPKHEHKEAGAAYLLREWFELEGEERAA